MSNVIKRLPIGTRIEVVDTTNLTVELGVRGTLGWSWTGGTQFMVTLDGGSLIRGLPVDQCDIIIDGKGIALGKKSHGKD